MATKDLQELLDEVYKIRGEAGLAPFCTEMIGKEVSLKKNYFDPYHYEEKLPDGKPHPMFGKPPVLLFKAGTVMTIYCLDINNHVTVHTGEIRKVDGAKCAINLYFEDIELVEPLSA